jgi:hypothetical protein
MASHAASFTTHNLHGPDLYRTPHGTVLQCACCDRLEVQFGRFSVRMGVDAFDDLCRTVARAREEMQDPDRADRDAWELSGGSKTIRLSREDIRHLYTLLAGAEAMRVLRESLHAVAEGRMQQDRMPDPTS